VQPSKKFVLEMDYQHGTMMAFTPQCAEKYVVELSKRSSTINKRIMLTFRQQMVPDWAKIGKTPSFGAVN